VSTTATWTNSAPAGTGEILHFVQNDIKRAESDLRTGAGSLRTSLRLPARMEFGDSAVTCDSGSSPVQMGSRASGTPHSNVARISGDKCSTFNTTNALENTPTGADCTGAQDFVCLARGFSPAAPLRLVGPDCANGPRLRAAYGLAHSTAPAGARARQRLAQSDFTPTTGPISAQAMRGLVARSRGPPRKRNAPKIGTVLTHAIC